MLLRPISAIVALRFLGLLSFAFFCANLRSCCADSELVRYAIYIRNRMFGKIKDAIPDVRSLQNCDRFVEKRIDTMVGGTHLCYIGGCRKASKGYVNLMWKLPVKKKRREGEKNHRLKVLYVGRTLQRIRS